MRGLAALCLASCIALLAPAAARGAEPEPCSLKLAAELPVKTDGGKLLIQVAIEGHDAWLQVDTGSAASLITAQLADELKLHRLSITGAHVYDVGGGELQHYVHIKTLTLNGMTAENLAFIVMGEKGGNDDRSYDGIFGTNFLSAYDVELDVPHGKMRLFAHNNCKGPPVYWTRSFVAMPFVLDASLHMVMSATLDGKPLRAMIDTGARPSALSMQVARRMFDIDPVAAGQKPDGEGHAGSGAPIVFYGHRFGVLDIGGVSFRNTELYLIPDKTSRIMRDHNPTEMGLASETNEITPLIIGMHHLARIRAYIAYDSRTIYISAADAQ